MKKFLFLTLAIPMSLIASEGDAFTARLFTYQDMNQTVSREFEKRINEALEKANDKNYGCNTDIAYKALRKELLRPFVGVLENWAARSDEVQGHYIKYKDSVYRDIKFHQNIPAHLGKIGMGKFFRVKETVISTDKLAHFLDIGHSYFEMVKAGDTLENALIKGIQDEKGMYGLKTTKIFSYADLVANLHGYTFWNSLFNDPTGNNYIACEKNKFVLKREFSLSEYVDDGWDESVNCNLYANDEIAGKVYGRISELEASSGLRLQCPAQREKCQALLEKYHDHSGYLISPLCY